MSTTPDPAVVRSPYQRTIAAALGLADPAALALIEELMRSAYGGHLDHLDRPAFDEAARQALAEAAAMAAERNLGHYCAALRIAEPSADALKPKAPARVVGVDVPVQLIARLDPASARITGLVIMPREGDAGYFGPAAEAAYVITADRPDDLDTPLTDADREVARRVWDADWSGVLAALPTVVEWAN